MKALKKICLAIMILCIGILAVGCTDNNRHSVFDGYKTESSSDPTTNPDPNPDTDPEPDPVIIDYDVTKMSRVLAGQFAIVLTSPNTRDVYVGKSVKIAGIYFLSGSVHNINVWDNCCGLNIRMVYNRTYPPNLSNIVIEGVWTKQNSPLIYYFAVDSLTQA